MIVKINKRGHSFKGVTAYLMHDKKSQTAERIEWSETGNMHTADIEKASKVMAWTDINRETIKFMSDQNMSGRKTSTGAVYHTSLSWAIGEDVSAEKQKNAALDYIKTQGLEEHQYYMVSHNDTDHKHVHIVANLINPDTGKSHELGLDKKRAQSWALEYEKAYGLHCKNREENKNKREQGEQVKHQDSRQEYAKKITKAYQSSDNGKTFQAALKDEGLTLASGRRGGFVLVDEQGDIQKLARQIDGVKTKDIKLKLEDIDLKALPDAEKLATELRSFDRDKYEAEQQKALEIAAQAAAKDRVEEQIKASEKKAAQEKRAAIHEKEQQRKTREKYAQYQKYIDKKTAKSKETWDIDKLEAKRDKAVKYLADNSSLWARITGRKAEASADLKAAQMSLKERRERWEGDIIAFNSHRPEWLQKRELEKQGFTYQKPEPPIKLKREQEEIKQKATIFPDKGNLEPETKVNINIDNDFYKNATKEPELEQGEEIKNNYSVEEEKTQGGWFSSKNEEQEQTQGGWFSNHDKEQEQEQEREL